MVKKAKTRKTVTAWLLAFIMLFSTAPVAAWESGAPTPSVYEVLSFAPLVDGAANRTVYFGTEEWELELPDVLYAKVALPATPTDLQATPTDLPPDERETFTRHVPVTWISEPEFNGFEPGIYIFTALPGDGFLPGYGVCAPSIAVEVVEAEGLMLAALAAVPIVVYVPDVGGVVDPGIIHNAARITYDTRELRGEWYYVYRDVYIDGRLTVHGNVRLVLMREANITVRDGIGVGAGATLTIWHTNDYPLHQGRLTVTARGSYAGIGGGGTVIINGGTIHATGASGNRQAGAGIGGYAGGSGGIITINAGNVTAIGGIAQYDAVSEASSAAGIGGGAYITGRGNISGSGGTITINGGIVNARSGNIPFHIQSARSGAGIGGGGGYGGGGAGGTITITGGTVNAYSGNVGRYLANTAGAGIGGGSGGYSGGSGGTITIKGGDITATGGTGFIGGAGIGGGATYAYRGEGGGGGTINIYGGNIRAIGGNITGGATSPQTPPKGGAGIGAGSGGTSGSGAVINVRGDATVHASGGTAGSHRAGRAIGGGFGASGHTGAGGTLTVDRDALLNLTLGDDRSNFTIGAGTNGRITTVAGDNAMLWEGAYTGGLLTAAVAGLSADPSRVSPGTRVNLIAEIRVSRRLGGITYPDLTGNIVFISGANVIAAVPSADWVEVTQGTDPYRTFIAPHYHWIVPDFGETIVVTAEFRHVSGARWSDAPSSASKTLTRERFGVSVEGSAAAQTVISPAGPIASEQTVNVRVTAPPGQVLTEAAGAAIFVAAGGEAAGFNLTVAANRRTAEGTFTMPANAVTLVVNTTFENMPPAVYRTSDNTSHSSLQAAVTAAQGLADRKITLVNSGQESITAGVVIPDGYEITLDLSGNDLAIFTAPSANVGVLAVFGVLAIEGTGGMTISTANEYGLPALLVDGGAVYGMSQLHVEAIGAVDGIGVKIYNGGYAGVASVTVNSADGVGVDAQVDRAGVYVKGDVTVNGPDGVGVTAHGEYISIYVDGSITVNGPNGVGVDAVYGGTSVSVEGNVTVVGGGHEAVGVDSHAGAEVVVEGSITVGSPGLRPYTGIGLRVSCGGMASVEDITVFVESPGYSCGIKASASTSPCGNYPGIWAGDVTVDALIDGIGVYAEDSIVMVGNITVNAPNGLGVGVIGEDCLSNQVIAGNITVNARNGVGVNVGVGTEILTYNITVTADGFSASYGVIAEDGAHVDVFGDITVTVLNEQAIGVYAGGGAVVETDGGVTVSGKGIPLNPVMGVRVIGRGSEVSVTGDVMAANISRIGSKVIGIRVTDGSAEAAGVIVRGIAGEAYGVEADGSGSAAVENICVMMESRDAADSGWSVARGASAGNVPGTPVDQSPVIDVNSDIIVKVINLKPNATVTALAVGACLGWGGTINVGGSIESHSAASDQFYSQSSGFGGSAIDGGTRLTVGGDITVTLTGGDDYDLIANAAGVRIYEGGLIDVGGSVTVDNSEGYPDSTVLGVFAHSENPENPDFPTVTVGRDVTVFGNGSVGVLSALEYYDPHKPIDGHRTIVVMGDVTIYGDSNRAAEIHRAGVIEVRGDAVAAGSCTVGALATLGGRIIIRGEAYGDLHNAAFFDYYAYDYVGFGEPGFPEAQADDIDGWPFDKYHFTDEYIGDLSIIWLGIPAHTVTFALNGGQLQSGRLVQHIPAGGDAVPPVVRRAGHVFSGWLPNNGWLGVTGDITITAQWVWDGSEEPWLPPVEPVPTPAPTPAPTPIPAPTPAPIPAYPGVSISFDPDGGVLYGSTMIYMLFAAYGSTLRELGYNSLESAGLVPERPGYFFFGWYFADGRRFTINTPLASGGYLKARWVILEDVTPDDWFFDVVRSVVANGLFHGTGDGFFEPSLTMSRAMFSQVLANMAGADILEYADGENFIDVPADVWYSGAVNWVAAAGIDPGAGGGRFDPEAPITREAMAIMLYSYARVMNIRLPRNDTEPFADFGDVSRWATVAVRAIQAAGIIEGRGGGNFYPQATATRAEVAAIFAMFLQVTQ